MRHRLGDQNSECSRGQPASHTAADRCPSLAAPQAGRLRAATRRRSAPPSTTRSPRIGSTPSPSSGFGKQPEGVTGWLARSSAHRRCPYNRSSSAAQHPALTSCRPCLPPAAPALPSLQGDPATRHGAGPELGRRRRAGALQPDEPGTPLLHRPQCCLWRGRGCRQLPLRSPTRY